MALNELYSQTAEPFVGVFYLYRPAIMIRDPELVKRILTSDFVYFSERGMSCDEQKDPSSVNLFSLGGARWKNLRSTLTPAFSIGQTKNMFSTIADLGLKMQRHLEDIIQVDEKVELKSLSARFVVEVLGSTIFGIETDAICNADDPLMFVGVQLATQRRQLYENFRVTGSFLYPGLLKALGMNSLPSDLCDFMNNLVKQTKNFREKIEKEAIRSDFMDLLFKATLNRGKSLDECGSNVFVFYAAGVEASSSPICFCLMELARNKQWMENVQKEIDSVLNRTSGILTYEALQEMQTLDNCLNETMRLYPALPILNRLCASDYKVPNSEAVIRKGTPVVIPIMSIQRDSAYFKDPLTFNPSRFDTEITSDLIATPFYPFGEGPRQCIGILPAFGLKCRNFN